MAATFGALRVVISGNTAGIKKSVQEAKGILSNFAKSARQSLNSVGNVAISVGAGAAGLGAAAFGWGVSLAAQAEQAQIAFGVMTGSAELAKKTILDLKEFAATTPFEFPEIRSSAQSLLAFGFNAQEITGILRRLGDVASGLGIPLQDLATIYGKARVSGRLMGEDINQLQERGIPILDLLAKQYGKTTAEVRKMVEQGKVGFADLEKSIVKLTDAGGLFEGMTKKQSSSLAGLFSTFKDAAANALENIAASVLLEVNAKGGLQNLTKSLEEAGAWIVKSLPDIFAAIKQLIEFAKTNLATFVPDLLSIGASIVQLLSNIAMTVARGIDALTMASRETLALNAERQANISFVKLQQQINDGITIRRRTEGEASAIAFANRFKALLDSAKNDIVIAGDNVRNAEVRRIAPLIEQLNASVAKFVRATEQQAVNAQPVNVVNDD